MGHIDEYTAAVYAEIPVCFNPQDYKRVQGALSKGHVPADKTSTNSPSALRGRGKAYFGMTRTRHFYAWARLLTLSVRGHERFGMEDADRR